MSKRDEWHESANVHDWLGGGLHFLAADEVAARLASPDCTDAEREWYAKVKPLVVKSGGHISAVDLQRRVGNPFVEDDE